MSIRRTAINLILAASVIALGLALWLTREPPLPAPQAVSSIGPTAITRITVRHENHLVELARDDAQSPWRITAPVAARSDPKRVAALLKIAQTVPTRRYARGAIDAKTTGVDTPELTVRYNDEAPIALGKTGPSPGHRYINTAHALLLAAVPDIEPLTQSWPHWTDPRLLAPDTKLTRLTLPHATLTRTDNGKWQAAPATKANNATAIRATLQAWQHARARSVVAADAARKRTARVTLRFADAPTRHLDVIARTPEFILRDNKLGIDYHLAPNHAPPMLDMKHPAALEENESANEPR